ncbi:MAG TPA: FGGY family carbohydrate kinase, partial [Thermoleophilaceae bacterium]|nr:FGGY family carbohydrate kinase [Thermoleophilaceae bacterium]
MDVVVGLDIGTTSAKAVAFDAHGAERGSAAVPYELSEPEPGYAVQDPAEVADGALRAAHEAIAAAQAGGARVAALSCSSAMHSLIGLDGQDRPLTPVITWADTRASGQAERLKAGHPDLHGRTGTPLHPMAPLAKLVWLRENDPDTFAAARRWVGIKELVVHRLTGEWLLDHSCASGTGLFDIRERRYDPQALGLAGVDEDRLSELVPTTHVTETADGTPLVVGAGDGPLANLGVGAVRPG